MSPSLQNNSPLQSAHSTACKFQGSEAHSRHLWSQMRHCFAPPRQSHTKLQLCYRVLPLSWVLHDDRGQLTQFFCEVSGHNNYCGSVRTTGSWSWARTVPGNFTFLVIWSQQRGKLIRGGEFQDATEHSTQARLYSLPRIIFIGFTMKAPELVRQV